jgi:3-hydroxybutyryl-CoA dehydratase
MSLAVGQIAETTRRYSSADIDDYVALGGHRPPGDTVPEPLVNALFSYLLGVRLPGQGTNYLKQESNFFETAQVGDLLRARVEITRLRPEKRLVDLSTTCVIDDGRRICEGRALVYVADVKDREDTGRDL